MEPNTDNDFGPPPSTLQSLGLTVQEWQDLELASRTRTPPFLFRGYCAVSRGRNSETGVIPQAFINGQSPSSMYDIPDLTHMINCHLDQHDMVSCFTSWTPSIDIAFQYSRRDKIAIMDTSKLGKNRIYSVASLVKSGLTELEWYADELEYMVYGPVEGPGYYCADLAGVKLELPLSPPQTNGFEVIRKSSLGGYKATAATVVTAARDGLARHSPSPTAEANIVLACGLMYLFRDTLADQGIAVEHLVDCLLAEIAELKLRTVDIGKSVQSVLWNPKTVFDARYHTGFFEMLMAVGRQIEARMMENATN
ncbi:hypothetical protein F5Y18DRAFT_435177 [Xylariaceae sp. FL1019]|nr:hypothetical protein F5Y18DRAFT_435177 [Xylariaceae sp. FL1019]